MAYFTSRRWLADAALLAVAAIWGSTFVTVKSATTGFPVLAFLTVRFTVAFLALLPLNLYARFYRRDQRRTPAMNNTMAMLAPVPAPSEWRWGAGAGLLFAAGYIFQTFALRVADSGRVGFVTGLYVVIVPLLGLALFRYRITSRILWALGLALTGMVFLGYVPGSSLLGDALAITCALSFAAHILVLDRTPASVDWRFMALVQAAVVVLICGSLLLILAPVAACEAAFCQVIRPFADPVPTGIPTHSLLGALYTGILATAVAMAIQIWAQRRLPANDAALIFAMEAPFSLVFGMVLLQEQLTVNGALGSGLIFAAMLVVTLGKRTPKTPDEGPHPIPS